MKINSSEYKQRLSLSGEASKSIRLKIANVSLKIC